MRKHWVLPSLLLASLFVIILSCSKEGPEGPPGPAGPQGAPGVQGPAGPTGPAGSANVIYSAWHTVNNANWRDSTLVGGQHRVNDTIATSITATIISQGVILAYTRFNNSNPVMLPTVESSGNPFTIGFIPSIGRMFYTCLEHDGTTTLNPINRQYRWVLIPGVVLGGRTRDPRTMTYQEVCQEYGIPE